MVTVERVTTAEQLWKTPGLGRCELVRGELVMMSPAGEEHGGIIVNVTVSLGEFVKKKKLGRVFSSDTGFIIAHHPDTVRAPDVAFVRAERLAPTPGKGYFRGAPDLAVEVLSPGDRAGEVLDKVHDWLDAGCLAVWLVDPHTRTVTVYRGRDRIQIRSMSDSLCGEDVVPGFCIPLTEVFSV